MRRLAVATALVLVALSAPALGDGMWGWGWQDERSTDLRYDVNGLSDLWLTNNNGSHAVALGYHGGGYWTIAVAEVRKDDNDDDVDSVMSYDWDDLSAKTPYKIWENTEQNPLPSKPCVAANGDWKFWMCTQAGDPGIMEFNCVGASQHIDEIGVHSGARINFTTASTQNSDTTFAGACYPGNSSWLFAAWENYDDVPEKYVLSARASRTGGVGWESDYVPIEWGTNTQYITQPSLATGTGDGNYVYVAYRTWSGAIKFERSSDHGETWVSQRTLDDAGSRPSIAAVGQFVFVCWHNSSNKIVYKFSNDAGGSSNWYGPFTIDFGGTYSNTSVSAITCKNHTGEPPGVLLVTQWHHNQKYYELYTFGERFETNEIAFPGGVCLSPGFDSDSLRPSLATAHDGTGYYAGRAVYNAPIPNHKRGFHLQRGAWTYFEII